MINRSRVDDIFQASLHEERQKTDRMFLFILLAEWVLAIGVALFLSPYAWAGKVRSMHVHLQMAILFGGALNALPLGLILLRPGHAATRHVVAAAQMLWAALLIHLTGGRIETHFSIFGSLAFLAFYRDWRVLVTATLFVVGDHLFRGLMWPESVYGIVNPEWWRFLEHAWWVVFENIVLVWGCLRGVRETHAMAEREASLENVNLTIEQEVLAKTAALKTSLERYKMLIESTNAVPWEIDGATSIFSYVSPQASRIFGIESDRLVGRMSMGDLVHPDDLEDVRNGFAALAVTGQDSQHDLDLDYRILTSDHRVLDVRSIVSVHRDGAATVFRGITLDITRQKKLEMELHQAQKLESVGRLAAGVAHEINTPVQFVSDSIHFVRDAMTELSGLIGRYRSLHASLAEGAHDPGVVADIVQAEDDADLDYVMENVPKALNRSLDGLHRVATIVRSMKEFAHPDQKEMTLVDLNQALLSTLVIAGNECKYVADVETNLGDIPLVNCHGGGLNQVFLNIIVNAAHAIGDVVRGTENRGRIGVRTWHEGESVVISISDTGGGIPDAIRGQVFDQFFTTKDVGKGTGQGLAIARAVIIEKHGGELTFETESGRGTTFFLRLPVAGVRRMGVAA